MLLRILTSVLCVSMLCGCNTESNSPSESERTISNKKTWPAITAWLKDNAPKIIGNLNPPATPEEIASVESKIGIAMPEDWKNLYLTHNGMNEDSNMGSLFYGLDFLSLEKVAKEFENNAAPSSEPPELVKVTDASINLTDIYNPKWIALAHDHAGNMIRVDMDPGEKGKVGQIIFVDIDSNVVVFLADSVDEMLSNFAADLKNGKYHLSEDALEDGDEFLNCDKEIDVMNWAFSPKWEHLEK